MNQNLKLNFFFFLACFSFSLFFLKIEVQLIYNIAFVSGVQHSDSVLFLVFLHVTLL